MTDTHYSRTFNYINYTILACIFPVGYFAPLGEWIIISILAISTIIKFLLNSSKVNLDNYYTPLIAIFLMLISCFCSINTHRSLEAIVSVIGMIIAIYIVLNISSRNIIKNLDNIIGIPIFLTSLCLFSDLVFNTEIRSSLALLVGDDPTSESGNFSRGIITLTMVMPISVALFINNKKYLFAFIILTLISLIVIFGPNQSSKVALTCSYFTALIVLFFGPKSFFYFGSVSLIWIILCPIIVLKAIPIIKNIDHQVEQIIPCSYIINSAKIENYELSYIDESTISVKSRHHFDIWKIIENNNCSRMRPWQALASGGSIVHRLLVWEYVGKIILNNPIIGHGIGTSRIIGKNITYNIAYTNQEIKGGIPLHPHNNFLQIWLELGLLGTLLISFIWIKVIKFGTNIRKNSYILGTGICTSIVTIFILSNLSFGVFQAWWMASVGLVLFLALQSAEDKNKTA